MNFASWFTLSVFLTANVFSITHHPSLNIHFDPWKKEYNGQLNHATVIPFENDHYLLLLGNFHPKSLSTHHSQAGLAYRKFLDDQYGFGINFVHAGSNIFGFHAHQFCPGLEIFLPYVQISLNKYWPLVSFKKFKDKVYYFNDVSEIIASIKPAQNFSFDLGAYYNHQSSTFGYQFSLIANVYDNVNIGIHPYFTPKVDKGIGFSIGYNFGKARLGSEPIQKSHRFFHSFIVQKTVKEKTPFISPTPKTESMGPSISIKPPIIEEKQDQVVQIAPKVEPKVDPRKEVITLPPPKPAGWLDKIFFWQQYQK